MNKLPNLIQRSMSGLVFIIIIISSILWSPYSFGVVFITIAGLALYEFHHLTNRSGAIQVSPPMGLIAGILLFAASFLHASALVSSFHVFSLYAVFVLSFFVSELFLRKEHPVNNWAYFFLAQSYIALPFALLNYIVFIQGFQPWLLLAMFITLWVNDTGAYVSGMLLGRHKMFERVSPKKTWEGFAGGALFTLVSGYMFSRYITDISLVQWLGFSLLVVVAGTVGDLCESLLKRTENVKDTGNIMPGHGGVLDRFDSMLLAVPVVLIYWSWVLR